MKRFTRPALAAALLALAAALALGATMLTAGAAAPPGPVVEDGSSGARIQPPAALTPLPDFKPTEELPADAAVAFPTDI